jgi:hypothetical protein
MSFETNPTERKTIPDKILRFQCPQGTFELDREAEYIQFTNFLQIAMAARMLGEVQDNDEFAIEFRNAFEETMRKDPMFFDGIRTIAEIPEGKWKELESEMHPKAA